MNLASQLAELGILDKYGVKLLGTQLDAIRKAEDRELFRALMREIKEPVPESWIVETEADHLMYIHCLDVPSTAAKEDEAQARRLGLLYRILGRSA